MCCILGTGLLTLNSSLYFEHWVIECHLLKGRLLKAVERTLSCDSASNSKVEKRVKDTSDSSEAHNSEALGPSGHFASDLAMIGQV